MKYSDKLKSYSGQDIDIFTSLFEYNIIWKEIDNEIRFIYKVNSDKYDSTDISKDTDIYYEYNFIDWKALYSFIGVDKKQFDSMDLANQIICLFNYYGYENIFGTSYYLLSFKSILRYRV